MIVCFLLMQAGHAFHRIGKHVRKIKKIDSIEDKKARQSVYWDKPLLRGEFHRFGAILYPPLLGLPLYLRAKPELKLATILFSLAVEGIMVVSATLHTFPWNCEKQHNIARKADFGMIFLGISLFYSSIGRLLMGDSAIFTKIIEPLVWICAATGIVVKSFFPDAPPWVNAVIFLLQGWAMGPLVPLLFQTVSLLEALGLFMGGIFITMGATAYSLQWPQNLKSIDPDIFGPHEVFHIGTIFMFVSFWFTMWLRVAR